MFQKQKPKHLIKHFVCGHTKTEVMIMRNRKMKNGKAEKIYKTPEEQIVERENSPEQNGEDF